MIRTFLATLILASAAFAQGGTTPQLVGITGVVVPAGPTICNPGVQYKLDCTDVYLVDLSGVDIASLVGSNVQIVGKQLPSSTCIILDVISVTKPPDSSLEFCGTPALGCTIRMKVCPPGLSQFWLFAAVDNGYFPFLSTDKGTWLLGNPFITLTSGFMDLACAQIDIVIPPMPILVGVDVWMQSARKQFGPNQLPQLGNAICFEILPPVVPCITPSC
jgi:hypothetical protein